MTKHQKEVVRKFVGSARWWRDSLQKRPVMDAHAVANVRAMLDNWAFIFERDFPSAMKDEKRK